ncbi:hypothetical protein ACO2Q0_15070 [Phenylobacterium sp. VNQ135]|uniref:terminase small subunit-like protein n=1 Tax=Phenylobacterium sp. VNQ135 TaxID=3400922 RepID=UPI003C0FF3DC
MTDDEELDAAFAAGAGVRALAGDRSGRTMNRWPAGTAWRIIRRTRAGETLTSICASPSMPAVPTVATWMRTRPKFAERMRQARAAAGRALNGQRSTYCEATAEAVFERLCAGATMHEIGADPIMPSVITLYRWLARHEEFQAAVVLARQIHADGLAGEAWRLAQAATPKTAYLTEVRLRHLRWWAARLWPRKYGAVKALDLSALEGEAAAGGGGGFTVIVRKFTEPPESLEALTMPAAAPGVEAEAAEEAEGRWT